MSIKKHYTFAAVADIHIDLENGGENTYFIHAQENFLRALSAFRRLGCRFVVSAGDQVTNASGALEEWLFYRQLIDASGYTGRIFEAVGNHELRFASYGGCGISDCLDEFIRMTRLEDKPVFRPSGKAYYEYLDDTFGDSFIFSAIEGGYNVNEVDCFSEEQMDWLESLLDRRTKEKRRIFLILHANFYGFGASDCTKHPCYDGAVRLTDQSGRPFVNNRRFFELIGTYKDVILLSGHTHVDFLDLVNYSAENGRACHMLHIPSLAGTTRLSRDESGCPVLDRTFHPGTAQGYLAEVYEDRVLFKGANFYDGTFYPRVTYEIRRK